MKLITATSFLLLFSRYCFALDKPALRATDEQERGRELATLVSKGLEFAQQLETCRGANGEEGLPIADWMSKIVARFGSELDLATRLIGLVEQTAKVESIFDSGYTYQLEVEDLGKARENQKLMKEAADTVSSVTEENALFIAGPLTSILNRILPNATDGLIAAMVLWAQAMMLILLANVAGLPPVYFIQIVFFQSPAFSLFLTFLTSIGGFSIAWVLWLTTMNIWCEFRPDSPSCPRNWLDNGDGDEEEEQSERSFVFRNGEQIVTDLLRCMFEQTASTIIPALLEIPLGLDGADANP